MKILINIGHPAHVHLFKNLIWKLQNKGHIIKIVARNKEVSCKLLDKYGFEYVFISDAQSGLFGLSMEMVQRVLKFVPILKQFDPDIVLSLMDPSLAITAKVLRKKSIYLEDAENAKITSKLTLPLTDYILTSTSYKKDYGGNHIKHMSYHQLAYLHPNYFTPNPQILRNIGLNENETFIVLRFVSWGSNHDIGHKGLTLNDKIMIVESFKKYGKVFISSENMLPPELESYKISLSPEKIHHLLYYATLLYSESGTMASEAAVLGTHAIFCDYAGRGYTDEQEEKYNLVFNFHDEKTMGQKSLEKALKLLENQNLKLEGKEKRIKLLNEKIDLTQFMVDFIEQIDKQQIR